jgi:hypothetical protein
MNTDIHSWIFAQADLTSVPAGFLKDFLTVLFALVVIAAIVVGVILSFRKPKMSIDPQPVEVRKSPKRYNHDLMENRHASTTAALTNHEERIRQLERDMPAMERSILSAGEEREARLQDQLTSLPDRIIATLANAKKLNEDA